MSTDDFYSSLGKLWSNFLSLDAVLRTFHYRLPDSPPSGVPYGVGIFSLPVGAELPKSALANRDYFSGLIRSYNDAVAAKGLGATVDASLVDLRNALAHGFVASTAADGPMRLIWFDRSRPGFVRVAINACMDRAWFKGQTRRVFDAILTVHAAVENLPRR